MNALELRGVVLPHAVDRRVFVAGGRITFEPQPDAEVVVEAGFLLPGLVDCHAHLAISSPAPDDAADDEAVRASASAQLAAGVLALREPGSPNAESRAIGPADGLPRVITAGRFVARRGRYFPGLGVEVDESELADEVERQVRASGAWAKVVGDFPGPDGRLAASFSPGALRDAAERVHAAGGRIAIHAVMAEVIEAAVEGGFDSIEHGTFMRRDYVEEMARRGTTWVPTLAISEPIKGFLASFGMPTDELRQARDGIDALPVTVKAAAEAGVRVLAGTDAGMVPHGLIAREVELLLRAGLSGEQAIGAASWRAREFLGLPGIEEGAPADIVVYTEDPRADAETLLRPVAMVLDGRRVR